MALAWARRAAVAALGSWLLLGPTGASAAPDDASQASARTFVQGFYDWYMGRIVQVDARQKKDFGFIDAVRQKPEWFSPELARLLKEDFAAASRCPGDVLGLDWDPFLDTQDVAPGYTAGKVERIQSGLRVSVDFHNKDAGELHNTIVQADVAFIDHHWRFVDFVQDPTDRKLREGLIATLKGYERSGEYKCPKS